MRHRAVARRDSAAGSRAARLAAASVTAGVQQRNRHAKCPSTRVGPRLGTETANGKDTAMFGRLVVIAGLAAGGYLLKKRMDQASSSGATSFVEDTI